MRVLSNRGQEMPSSPIRRLVPFADKAVADGKHVYYLNIGQPDIKTPETFLNPIKTMDMPVVAYGPSAGLMSLRKKFAEYYKRFDINVEANDILITTGGVSVGKYDYVKEIFSELGVDEIFWKVYIKPGKPIFFGKYENNGMSKLIFALPGNPVSSLVNFDVLVKPSILKKYSQPQPLKFKAILKNDIKKNDTKRHFVSGIIDVNKNEVITHSSQSSGNLAGFSKSNCLVEINEKTLNPKNGDIVECIMI